MESHAVYPHNLIVNVVEFTRRHLVYICKQYLVYNVHHCYTNESYPGYAWWFHDISKDVFRWKPLASWAY